MLPLYFISGVFLLTSQIPGWLARIANVFPVRHLAQALLMAYNPPRRPIRSKDEWNEHLRTAFVVRILAWEFFCHQRLFRRSTVEEVRAKYHNHNEPIRTNDKHRPGHGRDDSGIDGMPYESIRTIRHQFRLSLKRHWHAPILTQIHPRPNRECNA